MQFFYLQLPGVKTAVPPSHQRDMQGDHPSNGRKNGGEGKGRHPTPPGAVLAARPHHGSRDDLRRHQPPRDQRVMHERLQHRHQGLPVLPQHLHHHLARQPEDAFDAAHLRRARIGCLRGRPSGTRPRPIDTSASASDWKPPSSPSTRARTPLPPMMNSKPREAKKRFVATSLPRGYRTSLPLKLARTHTHTGTGVFMLRIRDGGNESDHVRHVIK